MRRSARNLQRRRRTTRVTALIALGLTTLLGPAGTLWRASTVRGDTAATSDGRTGEAGAAPGVLEPNAVVVGVVDGDTVDLRIGQRRTRVRLIGVNTPETVDPRRGVECFGPEAKAFTARLLGPGTRVRVERDIEPRDDYGRLLGYVYLTTDGTMVNRALIEAGYAVPLRIEPNTVHADGFRRAAIRAAQQRRGLWSACPR